MSEPAKTPAPSLPPVRLEVLVPLAPPAAFDLFTARIGSWWPLPTHSVAGRDAVDCRFEGGPDGVLVEVTADGRRHVWGRVLAWEPPDRLVLSWHPGRGEETAQEVRVRFAPAPGGCRVALEHVGWERLGAAAAATRDGYVEGWSLVLGTVYREAAEATRG